MVTNDSDTMDLLFRALAHAARRRVLDLLRSRPGMTVGDLAAEFQVTRIAVMKHLAVLSEAGLVTSQKCGRERRLFFNPIPIQQVHRRWVSDFAGAVAEHVLDIKGRVESRSSTRENAHAGS